MAGSRQDAETREHREQCERRQGRRRFRDPRAGARPPLLWTFPGSGNTWVRLLLDFATGLYTGSVYSDLSLLPLLPGEGACDARALAVKAHPTNIDFHDFVRMPGESVRLNVTRKPEYLKCARLRFDALVLLVRDPYASIWAEYKRSLAYRVSVANVDVLPSAACQAALRSQPLHSGGIPLSCFNATHFASRARRLARSWRHMWFHARKAVGLGLRLHQLSYEQLADHSWREQALMRLVEFVLSNDGIGGGSHAVAPPGTRSGTEGANASRAAAPTRERVACAFTLADDSRVHRRGGGSESLASASVAYAAEGLVCDMWSVFGAKARAAGYLPYGKTKCSSPAGKAARRRAKRGDSG